MLSIESGGKTEDFHRPDLSREELLYIALGGTVEQYREESKKQKLLDRQGELRSEILPGKRFKADAGCLKLFPDSPVWEIVRGLPSLVLVGDEKINNERRNKWWCSPVGWLGQFEMICCFDYIEEGFFRDAKDLPCPIDDVNL